ncbi:unnamed protein product [Rotaria sordida]|uniref:Uncharacterized protein n=3 Tax=Rotaria sordida TaxID=392033 RepID=A0A814ZM17_9BILA|nr:unnamed protein product [Rotaria sordida]CAF1244748.1 unnamed protein product [Rotaria sordida]CAF1251756.1 unnamed protein product [Rotaria sordida]
MQTITYLATIILSTLIIGGIFGLPTGMIQCPPDKPMVHCIVDPCSTSTCPGDKNATCISNYCGECNALWYKADGTPANCTKSSSCPPGQSKVQCFVDPCQEATCPAYPDAKCISNYCGGCKAEWFTSSGEQVQCGTAS